jgi:predicted house-cleaning NTP pyrophosphatase (Maf/HAM1 superfamily)
MDSGQSASGADPVPPCRLVLGSRSPRRLQLLRQIWPRDLIDVVPPTSTAEAQFEDLHDWASIERRLLEIACAKCDDVAGQVRNKLGDRARFWDTDDSSPSPPTPLPQGERGEELRAPLGGEDLRATHSANGADAGALPAQRATLSPLSPCGRGVGGEGAHDDSTALVVVTADTEVIVERAGGSLHVLGQPPADDLWADTVRGWFREDYAAKTHLAATALSVERLGTQDDARPNRISRVVTSRVTFVDDVDRWLDWYLATGEPRGKAGGYALQGAGSIFIAKVEGSLSNVVGLPLAELLEMVKALAP